MRANDDEAVAKKIMTTATNLYILSNENGLEAESTPLWPSSSCKVPENTYRKPEVTLICPAKTKGCTTKYAKVNIEAHERIPSTL